MDAGLARGRRGPVSEQPRDYLDRHAPADHLGGVAMAEHVGGKADPGPGGDAADQLVHRRVGHRCADLASEQVHEHVLSRTRRYLDLVPGMCF